MSTTPSRRTTRSSFKGLAEPENERPVSMSGEQTREGTYTDDSGDEARSGVAKVIETQSQVESPLSIATESVEIQPAEVDRSIRATRYYEETELAEPIPGVKRMKYNKKIPATLMERHWDPLPTESKASLERLMLIALNRTLEKYTPGKKSEDVRIRETQKMLAENWLNKNVHKSFLARLEATSLPPLATMKGLTRGAGSSQQISSEFLGLDQLSRKKNYLETYLLAELKQLLELELHYKSLEASYQLDVKYLAEFKKTTAKNELKMQQEITKKRADFNLDSYEKKPEGITLTEPSDCFVAKSNFNPDVDPDTTEVNQLLNKHLSSLLNNTQALTSLNDKVEVLYNYLDMM